MNENNKTTPRGVSEFIKDLLAVQQELPKLQKTAINPHFKNKYVPLELLNAEVLPILNKHSFVWITFPIVEAGEPSLRYVLRHASGEVLEGTMPLQAKSSDPQAQGSAITYARRYSLMAVLGLVADKDDDAQQATEAVKGPVTDKQKQTIYTMMTRLGVTPSQWEKQHGKTLDSLNITDASDLISNMKAEIERNNAESKHEDSMPV